MIPGLNLPKKKKKKNNLVGSFSRPGIVQTGPSAMGVDKKTVLKQQENPLMTPKKQPYESLASASSELFDYVDKVSNKRKPINRSAPGGYGSITDMSTGKKVTYAEGKFSDPSKKVPTINMNKKPKKKVQTMSPPSRSPNTFSDNSYTQGVDTSVKLFGDQSKIGWHERMAYNKQLLNNKGSNTQQLLNNAGSLDLQKNQLMSTTPSQAAKINESKSRTRLNKQEADQAPIRNKLANLRTKLMEQYVNEQIGTTAKPKKKRPTAITQDSLAKYFEM